MADEFIKNLRINLDKHDKIESINTSKGKMNVAHMRYFKNTPNEHYGFVLLRQIKEQEFWDMICSITIKKTEIENKIFWELKKYNVLEPHMNNGYLNQLIYHLVNKLNLSILSEHDIFEDIDYFWLKTASPYFKLRIFDKKDSTKYAINQLDKLKKTKIKNRFYYYVEKNFEYSNVDMIFHED